MQPQRGREDLCDLCAYTTDQKRPDDNPWIYEQYNSGCSLRCKVNARPGWRPIGMEMRGESRRKEAAEGSVTQEERVDLWGTKPTGRKEDTDTDTRLLAFCLL